MAIYNHMRPKTLKNVRGQKNVIDVLSNFLAKGIMPGASLFVGTRGTGKTSVARIVARMLNCENPLEDGSCCMECDSCKAILSGASLDVIELDAASHNSVDDIRRITDLVMVKPIGKKKVVILDEVHMLSQGAFNALLKVLEEPPADVHFILCTTEYQKVPVTILSRCSKFHFETISEKEIFGKLKEISGIYSVDMEDSGIAVIARAAKGSMRDAESLFESFVGYDGHISADMVRQNLGLTSEESIFELLRSIKEANPVIASAVIDKVKEQGGSLSVLLEDTFRAIMDIISIAMGGDIKSNWTEYYSKEASEYAFAFSVERLFDISEAFRGVYALKGDLSLALEGAVIGLLCKQSKITELENKIDDLTNRITNLQSIPISASVEISSIEDSVPEHVPSDEEAAAYRDVHEPEIEEEDLDMIGMDMNIGCDIPPVVPTDVPSNSVVGSVDNSANGFTSLAPEQIAEIEAMGFTVETDTASSEEDHVMEKVKEEDESREEMQVDESANFFDDFLSSFSF